MTILEKSSLRKRKAIISLVDKGEYSLGYALMLVEELHDNGKLVEEDYNYLADYIEALIDAPEEPIEEIEEIEEPIEEGEIDERED